MIKKTLVSLLCLAMPAMASAQQLFKNGWFNHIDFAVTGGTGGIGFDFATPMTDWARLRMGGEFRPLAKYGARFGMEVAQGLSDDENKSRYERLATMMESFTGYKPENSVLMQGQLGMNHFKMLVDIFPFKNNRHWYATVGFYYGNDELIEAKNTPESMNTLTAVTIYNTMYKRALANQNPIDLSSVPGSGNVKLEAYIEKLRKWGAIETDQYGNPIVTETEVKYSYDDVGPMSGGGRIEATATLKSAKFSEYGISIPIGEYSHDVVAPEDIYYDHSEKLYQEMPDLDPSMYPGLDIDPNADEYHYQKDANGRYIKKGEIRYKKGEVMHREGEKFHMVPDADNIIKARAKTNKFKPYIGIGYELSINKDKRFNVGADVGMLIWGGHPSIDIHTPAGVNAEGEIVYMNLDMTRDLRGLSESINDYVKSIKRYPVFPQISLRLSYRLW